MPLHSYVKTYLLEVAKHFTIPAAIQTEVSATRARRVFIRDAYHCLYCGESCIAPTVDHIRPQAHFAATAPLATVNDLRNLATACTVCNGSKGPQDLAGFARMLLGRGVDPAEVAAMKARVRAAVRRLA
jgi:5-methylcytosine-specific restriction endonuclease McrA